mmetsp:Transcript_49968/g.99219  ORF Transcript_49968/g.99219 Transcript_49968/m.99219 type:complete len:500 (+) Transcript_49968:73-1572(+)
MLPGGRLTVAPALEFNKVKELVSATSGSLRLSLDDKSSTAASGALSSGKGRFLAANCAMKAGTVVLLEQPLFCGNEEGNQSRKAYIDEFFDLSENEDVENDENIAHPFSPLADCLASILLTKQRELCAEDEGDRTQAMLQIQKLRSLFRIKVRDPVPEGSAVKFARVLRPELCEVTSEEEIHDFLRIIISNQFAHDNSCVDLMFAGSMFEHSCLPNCFLNTWRCAPGQARTYIALQDIAEGEALSIDYLSLEDAYLPTKERASMLEPWGFACSCSRCTSLPEVTRCFLCPACDESELCPPKPASEEHQLRCLFCGKSPTAEYTTRCFAAEAAISSSSSVSVDDVESAQLDVELCIGSLHHIPFREALWCVAQGPDTTEDLLAYEDYVDCLIQGISRLYKNPRHPHLLQFYHIKAALQHDNLDQQLLFLEHERNVLCCYYPQEAKQLDGEIMQLVQKNGPAGDVDSASDGTAAASADVQEKQQDVDCASGLSTADFMAMD